MSSRPTTHLKCGWRYLSNTCRVIVFIFMVLLRGELHDSKLHEFMDIWTSWWLIKLLIIITFYPSYACIHMMTELLIFASQRDILFKCHWVGLQCSVFTVSTLEGSMSTTESADTETHSSQVFNLVALCFNTYLHRFIYSRPRSQEFKKKALLLIIKPRLSCQPVMALGWLTAPWPFGLNPCIWLKFTSYRMLGNYEVFMKEYILFLFL